MTSIVKTGSSPGSSTRILIAIAVAVVGARILGSTPRLGANDISRWATVRALVDHGTYVIGHRDRDPQTGSYTDRGIIAQEGWHTVDKVLRPDTGDFYSSKPPLLSTLVAGEYWLLKKAFGWSITLDPWKVAWIVLLTFNGVPLLIYLLLLTRLVGWFGATEWGRFYVLTAGCFGTFLTTFAVTLNNHTVAATSALFALYPFLCIWSEPRREQPSPAASRKGTLRSALLFGDAGFFAAFTACNELPATLYAVTLAVLLMSRSPWRTLAFFLPAAAVPVAAFFITNYLAIGQLRPAYSELGGPWYQYEGSYWNQDPHQAGLGIDFAGAQETKLEYTLNMLQGHHGIFSLSPIYLLAVAGFFLRCGPFSKETASPLMAKRGATVDRSITLAWRALKGITILVTLVVVAFYIVKTSNYGGSTSGPRWFIWLAPFWLLMMLPVADRLSTPRWGRWLSYPLLIISIFSATYPSTDPWQHPWLYTLMKAYGWVQY